MTNSSTVTLGDLCDFEPTQVDPQDFGGAVYLGLEHLASGRLLPVSRGKGSDVQSSKLRFQKGDVLYGKLRPYLDKAVLAESDGVCTTELLVLRPKPGVTGRFLACVVHAPDFIRHAMAGVTGAHHPRTSWNHIRNFNCPVVDAPERKRIAEFVWATHDALVRCERLLVTGEQLRAKAIHQLFAFGLHAEPQKESVVGPIPKSWETSCLGSVATLDRGRFLHRPRNEPRFYGGHTPFVQTGDVVNSGGRLARFRQTLNDDGVAISRIFPKGTILITIAANIGFSAILQFDAACPDSLVAIQPDSKLDSDFLQAFLETQQPEMDRLAPKGTQKNINIQFLEPWPVPLPPMDEQLEIARTITAINSKIEIHRRKLAALDAVLKSLLHNLMTGEITASTVDLSQLDPTV